MTPPAPPAPPSLPAACTECLTSLQLAAPGSVPAQIAYKVARSVTGALRIDYAVTSMITNPATGVTLLLDHLKKEVRAIPAPPSVVPPQLKPPAIPGMPGAPPIPTTPAMAVKELGIKIVQGIEVMGKQITLPSLTPPKPPAAPTIPGAPALPTPPALPTIVESWVGTQLKMMVLSRITGSFGQAICHCKNTVAGEPPASMFQVPPDYKQVGLPQAPAPPAPPAMPAAPAMPTAPAPPAMPAMPKPPKPPTFSF